MVIFFSDYKNEKVENNDKRFYSDWPELTIKEKEKKVYYLMVIPYKIH